MGTQQLILSWVLATLWRLGDAGAHVGTVCDASFSTFMLTHWVRDRSMLAIGLRVDLNCMKQAIGSKQGL